MKRSDKWRAEYDSLPSVTSVTDGLWKGPIRSTAVVNNDVATQSCLHADGAIGFKSIIAYRVDQGRFPLSNLGSDPAQPFIICKFIAIIAQNIN